MDSAGTGAEPLKPGPRYRKADGASSIGFRRVVFAAEIAAKKSNSR